MELGQYLVSETSYNARKCRKSTKMLNKITKIRISVQIYELTLFHFRTSLRVAYEFTFDEYFNYPNECVFVLSNNTFNILFNFELMFKKCCFVLT